MSKKSKTPVIDSASDVQTSVAHQVAEQLQAEETLTINQVLAITGLSNVYVRKCIAKGTLRVTKGFIPGTKTPRNQISRADFETWRASIGNGTRRADGRNKYVLYLSPEEVAKLTAMIEGEPFAALLSRANVKAETEPTEA